MQNIIIDKTNIGNAFYSIDKAVERFALDNEPMIAIDWGALGDQDVVIEAYIEEIEDHFFNIDVSGCNDEFIEELKEVAGVASEVTHESDRHRNLKITVRYILEVLKVENGIMTLKGQWV